MAPVKQRTKAKYAKKKDVFMETDSQMQTNLLSQLRLLENT